jgi:uncharacterized protein YidB (DUF937 family)
MGILDEFMKQQGALGQVFDLVQKNPQILSAAIALLSSKDSSVGGSGGLSDLANAFHQGGFGDVMSSWISTSANKSISPADLASVLGKGTLGQFAEKAGVSHEEASGVLASLLPALVDHLTPQGQVPGSDSLDGMLGSLLSGLGR